MNTFLLFLFSLISITQLVAQELTKLRLMTFNILQGGGNAKNVGFEMNYLAGQGLMKLHLQSN